MDQQWLTDYQRRIEGMQKQAADVHEHIVQAKAMVTSKDGVVTVTVGASGALEDLRFSPRAGELSYTELGPLVMTTVRRAQRQVAQRVAEAFAPMGAPDTMELLTHHLPAEPEPEPGTPAAYNPPRAFFVTSASSPFAPHRVARH